MNIFQYYLDETHLKPGTKLKKGDEELKVVKPVGDDKYLVKEEDLDEALAYKQTHEKWGVVPKSKKEFVKFFDVNKEAEARAHAAKTGGTLKKIDQMGRAIKEGAEQIDELSKNTLSGYVAKASSSKVWHQDNAKYARHDQQDDIADEEEAKANKRKAGIKRAISKITKEAVDTYGKPLTEMKRVIATAIAKTRR